MGTAAVIEALGESRSFQTRHGSRVAIIGGGMLGTTLALRYRQAGRIVTLFESAERVDRRGHAVIASRDRALLGLLAELDLASSVHWDSTGINRLRFGAMPGGRARILETIRDRARAIDVDLRLGTPVRSISTDGGGFGVNTGSDTVEFDEVVITLPSPVAGQLVEALPDSERASLLVDAAYVGIINVSFVLKPLPHKATGGRYITHVSRGHDHFALLDPAALNMQSGYRHSVMYVTRPLAANDSLFGAEDREVIEHFARALPGGSHIASARVMRMPHAFARRRLESFTSSIPGLSIVNAAHMGGGRHHLERTAALAITAFRTLCAERIS